MKLLYIADGRSPIAQNWISYFIQKGYEVHLISTFPCQPLAGLAFFDTIPLAMSEVYGQAALKSTNRGRLLRRLIPVRIRTRVRHLVAPFSFSRASKSLIKKIDWIQPDLIHAMRIPYEGIVASMTVQRGLLSKELTKKPSLLVSVWGNDFTLHARSTPAMANHTCRTLNVCNALHTDCRRDLKLAIEMGFSADKPSMVLPGGGGIKTDVFFPLPEENDGEAYDGGGVKNPILIINPRGFRAYVRNDTFFRSIPLVLNKFPHVRFVCPGMANEALAVKWVSELGIRENIELLPTQTSQEMAQLFRRSQISVSITTHDGTPNTLLEAMASGCFPIVGDLESLREWITPGVNGLLVEPGDPNALAQAMHEVIDQPELRKQAREYNLRLVRERAEYYSVMRAVEDFYRRLVFDQ
jgi:glycosyltransferase involved in cell wall biosynthesis